MQKQIYIIFFASCALLAWLFRYDLEVGEGGTAHALDRWTGKISWIKWAEIEPVVPVSPPAPTGRDLFEDLVPVQPDPPKKP